MLLFCTFIGYNVFPILTGRVQPAHATAAIVISFAVILYAIFISILVSFWKHRKYLWAETHCKYIIKIDNNSLTVASTIMDFSWSCLLDDIKDIYITDSGGIVIQQKNRIQQNLFASRIERERLLETVEAIKLHLPDLT